MQLNQLPGQVEGFFWVNEEFAIVSVYINGISFNSLVDFHTFQRLGIEKYNNFNLLVEVVIPAWDVRIASEEVHEYYSKLPGKVLSIDEQQEYAEVYLLLEDSIELVSAVSLQAKQDLGIKLGSEVDVFIFAQDVHIEAERTGVPTRENNIVEDMDEYGNVLNIRIEHLDPHGNVWEVVVENKGSSEAIDAFKRYGAIYLVAMPYPSKEYWRRDIASILAANEGELDVTPDQLSQDLNKRKPAISITVTLLHPSITDSTDRPYLVSYKAYMPLLRNTDEENRMLFAVNPGESSVCRECKEHTLKLNGDTWANVGFKSPASKIRVSVANDSLSGYIGRIDKKLHKPGPELPVFVENIGGATTTYILSIDEIDPAQYTLPPP